MKKILFISSICIFLFYSCAKEECKEKYTVSGAVLNGTTKQGIKNKEFEINLVTFRYDGGIKERKTVGNVKTNDSGYFYLEYPCQNKNWEIIELDGGFDGTGLRFMGQSGFPFEKHLNKTFYKSSLGTLKVYLQPKTQWKDGDTLFVGYTTIDEVHNYVTDTFISKVSGLYKVFRHKPWGPDLKWGIGIKAYNTASYSSTIKSHMSGDPIIDSLVINY